MKERGIKLKRMVLASMFVVVSVHAGIVPTSNTFTGRSSVDGWYSFRAPPKATINSVVSYSSGAGPRWDYADNNDAVAQSAAESSEVVSIVAAGGTITGDGVLADGALRFNVIDDVKGSEYIAFQLSGTMEEGETVTFCYTAFNNADYWNMVQGQLWDLTTTNELAAADWITVLATSAVDYKPQEGTVSYTATAAEAGHVLVIVFREWGSTSRRDPYIDNISVTTTFKP